MEAQFQTPATQMKALIVDPMNQVPMDLLAKRSRLVIIDGLDECFPPESQNHILNILSSSLQDLKTLLYFLIASRPHNNIRDALCSDPFRSIIHTLPLEHCYMTTNPLKTFIVTLLQTLRKSESKINSFLHPGQKRAILKFSLRNHLASSYMPRQSSVTLHGVTTDMRKDSTLF